MAVQYKVKEHGDIYAKGFKIKLNEKTTQAELQKFVSFFKDDQAMTSKHVTKVETVKEDTSGQGETK